MKGLAFVKDPDGYLIEVLPQGEMITKPIDCAGVAVDGGSGCAQAGCQPGAPLLSSCVWDLPWLPESERAPACCLSRVYSGPCLLGSQIRTTANDRLINDRYDARLAVSLSVSRVSYSYCGLRTCSALGLADGLVVRCLGALYHGRALEREGADRSGVAWSMDRSVYYSRRG